MSFETPYKFLITEDAQEDIDIAIDVYSEFSITASERFEEAIEVVEDFLEVMPYAGHKLDSMPEIYYKTVSKKYQYAFYYRIDDNKLEVIAFAFAYNRRDPNRILEFLKERIKKLDNA